MMVLVGKIGMMGMVITLERMVRLRTVKALQNRLDKGYILVTNLRLTYNCQKSKS